MLRQHKRPFDTEWSYRNDSKMAECSITVYHLDRYYQYNNNVYQWYINSNNSL